MRVNEGSIHFSLDKNSSMEDLIRETFAYTLSLKRDYVSAFEIDKKTKEILVKTGRNRMAESTYVGDEGFDFNPYDDWEAQQNTREEFMRVNDDDTMLKYMESISYFDNDIWKKAMIAQFMKRGLHMKYRHTFRLLEQLKFDKNDDISKEDKKQFEETNKFINSVIQKRIEEYEPYMEKQWKDFYSWIKPLTNYYDDFHSYLVNRSSVLLDLNTKVKDIMGYVRNAYVGMETDVNNPEENIPNYGELYISGTKNIREFQDALCTLRENVNHFVNVNIEESCKLLDVGASTIRGDNIYAMALHHMYDMFGVTED